jgi:hypothetical protein
VTPKLYHELQKQTQNIQVPIGWYDKDHRCALEDENDNIIIGTIAKSTHEHCFIQLDTSMFGENQHMKKNSVLFT